MSSLGVSLLLLVVVAIVVVVGYNLRQGAWPRWRGMGRNLLERGRAARDDARRAAASSGNGRRSSSRGEPRLGDAASATFEGQAGGDALESGASNGKRTEGAAHAPPDAASGTAALEERIGADAHSPAVPAVDAGPGDDSTFAAPAAASGTDALAGAAAGPGASASGTPGAGTASARAAADRDAARGAPATGHQGDAAPRSADAPGGDAAVVASRATDAAGAAEAPAGAAPAGARPAGGPAPAGVGAAVLSEASDCIVELVPAAPLSGERLLALAQRLRRAGSKPVAFDGRAQGVQDGFEALSAGRSYEIVRVGILLANRHGPLNAMEFSDFTSAVQQMAESLSAQAEMPAMGSVLARARDLDSTCAQLDVQIGVNVEAPEAIEPAQLAQLAQALGLVERGSHRYVRQGPHGEPLFSLGFSDSPSRLTFLLDVPRVPASLEPFGRMVQAAGTCARRLGARLVDDSGKPLTQASLEQIARQLEQRYESLEAIGLPAGSALACKVFN